MRSGKFLADLVSELTQDFLIPAVPPLSAGGVRNGQVGSAPGVGGVGLLEESISNTATRDEIRAGSRQSDPVPQILDQQFLDLTGPGPVCTLDRSKCAGAS